MFSCQKHFSKVNPVQNDIGSESDRPHFFDRSFDAYKCRRDFDDPPTDFSWCL